MNAVMRGISTYKRRQIEGKRQKFERCLDQARTMLRTAVQDGIYTDSFQSHPLLDAFQAEEIVLVLKGLDDIISSYYGYEYAQLEE